MLLIWWKWKVMSCDRDSEGNEELPAGEFEDLQGTKIAVQYAAAYLYEHREEADHHQLVLDLRSLLSGVRKPGF